MAHGTMYATKKAVLKKKIKDYLRDYNPAGYGTHFYEIEEQEVVISKATLTNNLGLSKEESEIAGKIKIYSVEYSRGDSCD